MAFLSKKYRWLLVAVCILVVVGVATYVVCQQQSTKLDYDILTGKWVRPDGGYVLDITAVRSDGSVEMSYLNPRPINVSKATADIKESQLNLFVELRDKYYPGNYYTLTFDSKSDRLVGVYYHLGLNQKFNVYFIRR